LPSETVLNRLNDSGNIKTIYSLIGAAVVIILLACVNFMNLSTAQFSKRIKEAGLRKILGLSKKQLIMSYFLEALVFCAIALLTALAITEALLPAFNLLTGKALEIRIFGDLALLGSLLMLVLVMALVSSSYPAWFLSRFNLAEATRGKIKTGREGKSFRNSLVIFQFAVSIVLMISTVIVFQQLNYVSEKDLGFNKENLLVLKHVEGLQNAESLTSEASRMSGVLNVSYCSSLPPNLFGGDKFTAERHEWDCLFAELCFGG
jgi:putative ABC transport system permease protein